MTFKRILAFAVVIVALLSIVACGNGENEPKVDPNDPFTGKWMETRDDGFATTYEFDGDGTGMRYVLDLVNEIKYTYDETYLYLDVYVDNPPVRRTYAYIFDGDTLTLTSESGDVMVLKKQ